MGNEIAGPPAPNRFFSPAEMASSSPELPERSTLKDVLLPILLAQGLDFISTEEPIGFLRHPSGVEEMNRFPGARAKGFGGTLGRMGSGAAELGIAAMLSKFYPALGRAYRVPSMSTHMSLSRSNMDLADMMDRHDRLGVVARGK